MYSASDFQRFLKKGQYVSEGTLDVALSLANHLGRPLLLEGDAGVGKTFVAQALAKSMGRKLIRLQCYEGLDAAHAIYEWNYSRQMLSLSRASGQGESLSDEDLFSEKYLIKRPLLEAISQDEPPILLIDEVDRADEEFEAFLLEILSEYQISIPEMGIVTAKSAPLTILTSNGVRDLSEALRRRCLFHHIDYPDGPTELRIIQAKVPECSVKLAQQVTTFIQALRREGLKKIPGIAETLDWTAALIGLDVTDLAGDPELIHQSLICVLKTKQDRDAIVLPIVEKFVAATV